MKKILTLLTISLFPLSALAQVITYPNHGGTGTAQIPSWGQVLVGQSNGTYLPQATSTLGIAGGGGGGGDWTGTWQMHSPSYFQIAGAYLTNLLGGLNAIFGNSTTTNAVVTVGLTASQIYAPVNTILSINSGQGVLSGSGKKLILQGGSAGGGIGGGDLDLRPGAGGYDNVKVSNSSGINSARFDTSGISGGDKIFTFPNQTGTFVVDGGSASSLTITNASTTNLSIGSDTYLTGITNAVLAVDNNHRIISTTTSAGGVTNVSGTYPIQSTNGATPVISIAFGTTTSNTWAGVQTMTNASTTNLSVGTDTYLTGLTSTYLAVNAQHKLIATTSPGTVTAVSVTTANGVSGSVATPNTTPAITLTLGAITPTSVNGLPVNTGLVPDNFSSAIGNFALDHTTTGLRNTSMGYGSSDKTTTGNDNTSIGLNSLGNNVTGDSNTTVGGYSLFNALGASSTAIGYSAGRYETGGGAFYVDNQDRLTTAGDKAGALLYGTFNATPANQTLRVNASTTVAQNLTVLGTGTSTFSGAIIATCFATSTGQPCITGGGGGSATLSGGTTNAMTYWTSASTVGATTSPVVQALTLSSSTQSTIFSEKTAQGFTDIQRGGSQTDGNGYTLVRIKSPIGHSQESTLTLLNDMDNNNAGAHESFVDFYNENYSDSNQAGIRVFASGAGVPLKPFLFGYLPNGGAKDPNNVFGMLPGGTFFAATATSTVDGGSKVYISSSTATRLMTVDQAPGTHAMTVFNNGHVALGATQVDNNNLSVYGSSTSKNWGDLLSGMSLFNSSPTVGNWNSLVFGAANQTTVADISSQVTSQSAPYSGGLTFSTRNLAGTYKRIMDIYNGKVEIGSTTSSSSLAVYGTTTSPCFNNTLNGACITGGGGGSGTVTSITAGRGLAGGTITTTGTISALNQSATFIVSTTTVIGEYTDIQTAINAASSTGSGGTIHIKAGTYTISAPLTFGSTGITLEGEGTNSTIIAFNGASVATSTMTKNRTFIDGYGDQMTIKNLQIQNTNANIVGTCIDAKYTQLWKIDNVFCANTKIGIWFDQALYDTVNNFQWYSSNPASAGGYGIYLAGNADGTTNYANSIKFTGVTRLTIDPSSTFVTGVYADSQGVSFDDLDIESGANYCVDIGADAVGIDMWLWCEGNNHALRMASGAHNIHVTGGEIAGNTDSSITTTGVIGFQNDAATEVTNGGYDWNGVRYFTGANFGFGTKTPTSLLTVADVTSGNASTPSMLITGNTNFAKVSPFLNIVGNNATDSGNLLQITNPGTGASLNVVSGKTILQNASTTALTVNGIATVASLVSTTTATSTFAGGVTSTCFSTGSGCITGGGGSGTVNSGTTGQVAMYKANGTAVSGTSTMTISNFGTQTTVDFRDALGNLSNEMQNLNGGNSSWLIGGDGELNLTGNTSSGGIWSIVGQDANANYQMYLTANSDSFLNNNHRFGIGSSTPWAMLSVQGTSSLASTPIFAVASSTAKPLYYIDSAGHQYASTTVPVLSSCGTSPSLVGNDNSGTVTVGSVAATGCTLTFGTAWRTAPNCTITNQSMSVANAMTYTISSSAIVVSQTALTGNKLNYMCQGNGI